MPCLAVMLKMNNEYIVYKHTSPNGKVYIGITSQNPERRWRKNGEGYKDHNYFWNAIQKYGWDNFTHEILFNDLTAEQAYKKEQEFISYYKSNDSRYGYNLSSGGESGSKGYKYSEEQRQKMSESRRGDKNGMYGKHHTEESKRKISTMKSKENLSAETIKKMSDAKKGKKRDKNSIKKQIDTISNPVICVETLLKYKNAKIASRHTGIDSSCISKVCRGIRQTAGGFHWRRIKDTPCLFLFEDKIKEVA